MSAFKALGLDPKMYKHVKTDDKTTTLQHKQGHVVTIAHSVLSPKMQNQLKALANVSKEAQTNTQAQEAQDQSKKPMAQGGFLTKNQSNQEKGVRIPSHGNPGQSYSGHAMEEAKKHPEQKDVHVNNSKHIAKENLQELRSMPKANIKGLADGGLLPYDEVANYNEGTPDQPVSQGDAAPQVDPSQYNTPMQSPEQAPQVQPQEPKKEKSNDEVHPDLSKEFGQIIGKYGVAPVAKAADMFIKGGVDAVKSVGRGAGRITQGVEEGVGLKTPENPQQQQIQDKEQAANDILNNAKAQTPPANQPTPGQAQQPQQANTPQEVPPQQPDPMGQAMDENQGLMEQGFNTQMTGIGQEAKAQGALGEAKAAQIDENIKAQNEAKIAYQKQLESLETERQGIIHDMDQGHIDPQKYWTGDEQGNGGHSKIMAGIGMILAGFNPTNNPNAAINFLKFQMEQNLEAQKQNLNSKNNLLRANLDQFHNLKDATDMTRLQNAEILGNQLAKAAATAATPLAKAEALKAQGALQQQYAPLAQQFAMRRAMVQLANNGAQTKNPSDTKAAEHMLAYMRMTNPEQAKEMEERLVPGVGLANVKVPQEVRQQLVSHQKLADATNDTLNFAKTHSTIIPGTPEYHVGIQKSMVLQQMIREGLLGTVFRESEKPLLNKMVDENPAGLFKQISSNPKLRTILESNMQQANALKRQYGLPQEQQAQSATVQVISPDGTRGNIPRANLQRALAKGYKAVGQ